MRSRSTILIDIGDRWINSVCVESLAADSAAGGLWHNCKRIVFNSFIVQLRVSLEHQRMACLWFLAHWNLLFDGSYLRGMHGSSNPHKDSVGRLDSNSNIP